MASHRGSSFRELYFPSLFGTIKLSFELSWETDHLLTPQANGPLLSDIWRGRGAALGLDEKCPLQARGVGMRPYLSCSLGPSQYTVAPYAQNPGKPASHFLRPLSKQDWGPEVCKCVRSCPGHLVVRHHPVTACGSGHPVSGPSTLHLKLCREKPKNCFWWELGLCVWLLQTFTLSGVWRLQGAHCAVQHGAILPAGSQNQEQQGDRCQGSCGVDLLGDWGSFWSALCLPFKVFDVPLRPLLAGGCTAEFSGGHSVP